MRILVAGGLGFIGHHVVRQLTDQGHIVRIIDNITNYGIIPVNELNYVITERKKQLPASVISHQIDIESSMVKFVFEMFLPEVVIHLASFPRQKIVNANPQLGSRVMSEGLLNLLELSVKHCVKKFVYISSSMVYGNFDNHVTETAECHPQGQYGILKLAGEWLVQDYGRQKRLGHVIIRPSAVYGPRDVDNRVVSKFLITAMRGREIQVNGANEALDFTYVDDAARGITAAALSPLIKGIYNMSRGHAHTLMEAAELAVKIAGSGTIRVNDRDLNFPSRGSLSIAASQHDLGFDPKIDFDEGFVRYHQWLKTSCYQAK